MPYILNAIYLLAAMFASPWLCYQALAKGKYRQGFAAKLFGSVPRRAGDATCVWLHAVSVGEVNLIQPLIEELESRFPDCRCVVSTTTMTGYALACKKYGSDRVFYAPLDFSWAVRRAMRRVRPALLVLAELELWPNLISAARAHGAQVAVINGRLSEHSFRGYLRIQRFFAPVMQQIDLIAAQTDDYACRFRTLGANPASVRVTGSLKYDGAQADRDNPATQRLARLAGISGDDIVFLAGSTQEPEESLALETYLQLRGDYPQLRLVLVPRHPDRFEAVARLLEQSGLPWQRRSALEETGHVGRTSSLPALARNGKPEVYLTPRILLVDCIGELGAWWGTAQIAFVGGSLSSRGGQNMIEPAAYGAAVSFGPNTRNFRDIVAAMLSANAAVVVQDGEQLTAFVRRALEQPEFAAELGRRAAALVERHQGATSRTVDLLEPFLAAELVVDACPGKAA